ncbi:hypothetical protein PR202_ga17715 [Eleusine coracana subsp. coracana]|uniref:Pentatricopeptide repeat-containing protein n=1 Tax=Eleusine coracana subsp. coracana TaxID=191504 RepID=A0AAV5CR06_ELECO|nr:hypothetical protein PR202_ga17468 [Eleusine coracana subsp. coracana]GJN00526.1 hypothetical protein PR202_ga17715 [Eleusine coracana subsp. coracana]
MPHRSVVSWTAMLSGYAKNGRPREALELFVLMLQSGARPNQFTFGSTVSSCAATGCVRSGEQVHACAAKGRFAGDMVVQSALMDMHLRCGSVVDARRLFAEMPFRNVISWTSLITACAQNGLGEDAVTLFDRMEEDGVKPNDVTFLSLLSACSHSGMMNRGVEFFKSMMSKYGIDPRAKHYSSAIDLLARGGQLEDAWRLVQKTNAESNSSMYGAMLGACKLHGNMSLGEAVAKNIFSMILRIQQIMRCLPTCMQNHVYGRMLRGQGNC